MKTTGFPVICVNPTKLLYIKRSLKSEQQEVGKTSFNTICCIFSGTVAIWNLLTESSLLKEKVTGGAQTFRKSN